MSDDEAEALAAVSIAVVEGLGIQRALDPEGFDHERAWRAWRSRDGRLPPLRLRAPRLADSRRRRLGQAAHRASTAAAA